MRRIDHIVVHCTATRGGKDFKAKDIDRWHKEFGWECIGYHYVVLLDGTIENCCPEEQVGRHVKNHNAHSIGIVYVGGLDQEGRPKDTRTQQQKAALLKLLKELKARYPSAQILGHRDSPGVKKPCPCFNAKEEYAEV